MGTVVGIIDGAGSLGAAFGQLMVISSCTILIFLDWHHGVALELGHCIWHDVIYDLTQQCAAAQISQKRVKRDHDTEETTKRY